MLFFPWVFPYTRRIDIGLDTLRECLGLILFSDTRGRRVRRIQFLIDASRAEKPMIWILDRGAVRNGFWFHPPAARDLRGRRLRRLNVTVDDYNRAIVRRLLCGEQRSPRRYKYFYRPLRLLPP